MWVLLQPTEHILAEVVYVASQSGSVLVKNSNEVVVMVIVSTSLLKHNGMSQINIIIKRFTDRSSFFC